MTSKYVPSGPSQPTKKAPPAKKMTAAGFTAEANRRCGNPSCEHTKKLHEGEGKTRCAIKGCPCKWFVEVEAPKQVRVVKARTLDRSEQKMFDITAI